MEDYREDIITRINLIVGSDLDEMTEGCKQYYLSRWNHYCDELEIDYDTSDEMYLWIVMHFDPDFDEHNH